MHSQSKPKNLLVATHAVTMCDMTPPGQQRSPPARYAVPPQPSTSTFATPFLPGLGLLRRR